MGAELLFCTNDDNIIDNCLFCHLPKKKKVEKMTSPPDAADESLNDSIVFQYDDDDDEGDEEIVKTSTENTGKGTTEEEKKVGLCMCEGDTTNTDDDDSDAWTDDSDWSDDDDTILTSTHQHEQDVDFDDLFGPVCTDFSNDLLPPPQPSNRGNHHQQRCSSPCDWSDDEFDDDDGYSILNNAHLLGGENSTAIDERREKIREMGKHEKVEPHTATKVKFLMEPTEVREDIDDHVESLAEYRFSLVKFMIADRMRFNRRIRRCKEAIEWCLDPQHRAQKQQQSQGGKQQEENKKHLPPS